MSRADRPDRSPGPTTEAIAGDMRRADEVPRFQLLVVEGPETGKSWESKGDACSVGSHPSNDLVVDDPTVSRFHCEVRITAKGATVRDLDSRNGTNVDGVQVMASHVRGGSLLRLGRTTLRFDFAAANNRLPVSEETSFGTLVGSSVAMRCAFAILARAAATTATVLLEGETGTGKERAAESIHRLGPRADEPFVVVDCGAIPANLLESELFGHEKGAFTGAHVQRKGRIEHASGGTLFLDEIGEIPFPIQVKLLRFLQDRRIERVGGRQEIDLNVRVIAATNADLQKGMENGTFREDLFYRLAVVKVILPPLRERGGDIHLLAQAMLHSFAAETGMNGMTFSQEAQRGMARHSWPGNVREL